MKNEKPKHTPGPRCTACKWVHEANSETGESFMGVELCPLHASAPELLAALEDALNCMEILAHEMGKWESVKSSEGFKSARAAADAAAGKSRARLAAKILRYGVKLIYATDKGK